MNLLLRGYVSESVSTSVLDGKEESRTMLSARFLKVSSGANFGGDIEERTQRNGLERSILGYHYTTDIIWQIME